jgi:hypothetical protein
LKGEIIDYEDINSKFSTYRMHIFPMKYDEFLPFYYNNNQRFLQKRLDSKIIKKSKLFEKAEIKWVCVDDIIKMRPKFRSYFQNIIDIIYAEKNDIKNFISISFKKNTKKKTLKKR